LEKRIRIESKDVIISRQVALKAAVELLLSERWEEPLTVDNVLETSAKIANWLLRGCALGPESTWNEDRG
jgi:hypothetical protein